MSSNDKGFKLPEIDKRQIREQIVKKYGNEENMINEFYTLLNQPSETASFTPTTPTMSKKNNREFCKSGRKYTISSSTASTVSNNSSVMTPSNSSANVSSITTPDSHASEVTEDFENDVLQLLYLFLSNNGIAFWTSRPTFAPKVAKTIEKCNSVEAFDKFQNYCEKMILVFEDEFKIIIEKYPEIIKKAKEIDIDVIDGEVRMIYVDDENKYLVILSNIRDKINDMKKFRDQAIKNNNNREKGGKKSRKVREYNGRKSKKYHQSAIINPKKSTRRRKIEIRTKKRRIHKNFIHKALYQKKNECGLGTYTKVDLPKGTIIMKEIPVRLDEPNDYRFYQFKLMKKLLTHHKKDFMKLVPSSIDSHAKFDEELMKEGREKFFPELSMDELKLYYLKYKRNAFSFDGNPGILFTATRLNHSCEPNVAYHRDGNHMIFKTKHLIKAGEELFDSYISINMGKGERKEALLRRYGFDCQCCRCKQEN